MTWRVIYGGRRIPVSEKFRRGEKIVGEDLQQARNRLAGLYRSRVVLYSLYRARLVMKARFLLALTPLLLALVCALAVAIATRPGAVVEEVLLAAAAGAVGATLSGIYKLRDHIEHLNALRAFRPALFVQPLLGAAAGLFLLLVLTSGFLEVNAPGPGWATIAMVALVAGFSEPFVLGVVQRVAGIADIQTPEQRPELAPIEAAAEDGVTTDAENGRSEPPATAQLQSLDLHEADPSEEPQGGDGDNAGPSKPQAATKARTGPKRTRARRT